MGQSKPMPARCGFNFQWLFHGRYGDPIAPVNLKALDFMARHGFAYVRIPTCYWLWTKDFDYLNPDESVFEHLDRILEACRERGLHMALNIHRAPGYCINRNDMERHSLWTDQEAQDGFVHIWTRWAERYKGVSNEHISFDLLNEPSDAGQRGFTRDRHAAIMLRTIDAIRAVDPDREIALNGVDSGHSAIPELARPDLVHSGRGYQPMSLSHQGATWWDGWKGSPEPVWPGAVWDNRVWSRDTLVEFYEPWRKVEQMGTRIHMGEFGCFNHVHNEIALAWLGDLLSIWKQYGWGWGLWSFEGAFGIVEHGRPGAIYQNIEGFNVDKKMLDLLVSSKP